MIYFDKICKYTPSLRIRIMGGFFDSVACMICLIRKGEIEGSPCCGFRQLYCIDCADEFRKVSYANRCPGCGTQGWRPSFPFRFQTFSDYLNCLLYHWMKTVNRGSVSICGLQPFYSWIVDNNYMTPQYVALLKGKGKFLKIVESSDPFLNRSHFIRNGKIDIDLCSKNLHRFAYSYYYSKDDVLVFLNQNQFTRIYAENPLEPLKELLVEYFRE